MKNTLIFNNTYVKSQQSQINQFSKNWSIEDIYTFLCDVCNIDTQMDQDIIKPYTRDWSNIPGGHAELLVRPALNEECALLFAISNFYKIPITISAGQTNLTGSATPEGGIILSTSRLNTPFPDIDVNNQTVTTSIGIC